MSNLRRRVHSTPSKEEYKTNCLQQRPRNYNKNLQLMTEALCGIYIPDIFILIKRYEFENLRTHSCKYRVAGNLRKVPGMVQRYGVCIPSLEQWSKSRRSIMEDFTTITWIIDKWRVREVLTCSIGSLTYHACSRLCMHIAAYTPRTQTQR